MSDSILEKVLENKQADNLNQFDPQAVLNALFGELNEREQRVLTRRFGLDGSDPQTLEVIGKHFGVTRERVRQIETGSIKKLRKLETLTDQLKQIETVMHQVLEAHGGILEEEYLLDKVLSYRENSPVNRAILLFFIEKLLEKQFDCLSHPEHFHRSWKLVTVDHSQTHDVIHKFITVIEELGCPVEEDELVNAILEKLEEDLHDLKVRGHLRISKKLKQNIFGKWGLANWNSITPKRMNDKIYLVLQHVEKPMHFTEIADKINELNFDHKTAYPATVHNELILDDKYVLVGRGIYALSEWGYEPGVVADVIERVLKSAGRPLSREDIVEQVLEQRIVGKSTIHLALMNKNKFEKTEDGKYALIEVSA